MYGEYQDTVDRCADDDGDADGDPDAHDEDEDRRVAK